MGAPLGFLDDFLQNSAVSANDQAGLFCFNDDFAEAWVKVYVGYFGFWSE